MLLRAAERGGEGRHEDRRGRREPQPRQERAQRPAAREPDQHPYLARGGSREHRAKRDDPGVGRLVEPPPLLHEGAAEIGEVSDRTAERRRPQPEERREHLAHDARLTTGGTRPHAPGRSHGLRRRPLHALRRREGRPAHPRLAVRHRVLRRRARLLERARGRAVPAQARGPLRPPRAVGAHPDDRAAALHARAVRSHRRALRAQQLPQRRVRAPVRVQSQRRRRRAAARREGRVRDGRDPVRALLRQRPRLARAA